MGVNYQRQFAHEDWIDNEDIVQASGDRGFNKKFHALEDEFDGISTAIQELSTQVDKIQQLQFMLSRTTQTLAAKSASEYYFIERYNRDDLPENIDKAYFIVLYPQSGPTYIQHTILYSELPGNEIQASVQFYNPGDEEAEFSFRVMNLAVKST